VLPVVPVVLFLPVLLRCIRFPDNGVELYQKSSTTVFVSTVALGYQDSNLD
jgi:hypothetical protein